MVSAPSEFQLPQRQLRAEMTALAVALGGALLVGALDLGVKARADEPAVMFEQAAAPGLLDAAQAEARAAEQGVVGRATSERPTYSLEWDRAVFRVSGEQRAVIDAHTGELLQVGF